MALDTYANLQTAMSSWLGNSLNSASYPDMITLFEAAANRRLRVRQQEAMATITMSSGAGTLPTDYLSWRRVNWPGNLAVDLDYVEPTYLYNLYPTAPQGDPRLFTIEGSTITVRPVDDTSLTLSYFQKIAALSATLNWLFVAHPDVYLFGALVEAETFGVNDERAPMWLARRDAIFDEIERLSNKSRGGGAMRVAGPTP
jgi:hypothetical protein